MAVGSRSSRKARDAVTEWVTKRRGRPLPEFLSELNRIGPDAVLDSPAGRRDAERYLITQWAETVQTVARPDSLPVVVEHRQRVRVHPVVPAATAAAAGISAAAVANSATGVVEVFGVVGVVAASGLGAALLWRPRARRRDRQFTMTGGRALVARGEVELSAHGMLELGAGPAGADSQFGELLGASRILEQVEAEASASGLLTPAGTLVRAPATPAERGLTDEVLSARIELVHALTRLSSTGHADRARQRQEERGAYRSAEGSETS